MSSKSNFFEHSKKITHKFLHTVLAVDDNLVFETRQDEDPDLDQFGDIDVSDGVLGASLNDGAGVKTAPKPEQTQLYYQDLSSSFAKEGIVCSGFRPFGSFDESVNAIYQSSRNADITILDWQMDLEFGKQHGDLAKASIKKILEGDQSEGGRLRLITIYTSMQDIGAVAEDIKRSLPRKLKAKLQNCIIIFEDTDGLLKHTKVEVLRKDDINETGLHHSVVDSFAYMTAGLLSNAALSAITDLRNNTHNILHKFGKELDSAYLSHVIALISSKDMREQSHEVAFDYAVEILSEEIKSQLQTSQVLKKSLASEAIHSWPKYVNSENNQEFFGLKIGEAAPVHVNSERIESLLKSATNETLERTLSLQPKLADIDGQNCLDVFEEGPVELSLYGMDNDGLLKLSTIQCVRRDTTTNLDSHRPVLKQGTVLKSKGKFYVCVQPLCDSVRLTRKTNFAFVRIDKTNSEDSFTHVVNSKSGFLKFNILPTSKKVTVFPFEPVIGLNMVQAAVEGKKLVFKDAENQKSMEWICEFKQPVSQAIVNAFSASLSRVGFDSLEWLRIKAKH